MLGIAKVPSLRKRLLAIAIFSLIFLSGCLGDGQQITEQESEDAAITLDVWYTFAPESKEEVVFMNSIRSFEAAHPNVTVDATMKPYTEANQVFMTAAQGGQAPDLMRFSNDQLGAIGEVRVNGFPLLEDLRPHLTPQDRSSFEERALQAMRYGDALYGLPASQDCLTLIYNKALFDSSGVSYPDETWTEDDLLEAAKVLTNQEVQGLAIPIKTEYWWYPIQGGFGGSLFDENGTPSLDSNGSSEAMRWMLDLELEHGVVATGTQAENMKNQFVSSEAAMIFDGPWNWATYEASRLNLGQTLLPLVESTGERMSPLVTYKGWSVSKQSANKIAAAELALWLSSQEVQKEFALETYTMPTHVALESDSDITGDDVLSGFLNQTKVGIPAPTTQAMSLIYGPLGTAFDQAYLGIATTSEALTGANQQLQEQVEAISRAEPFPLAEGYRTIRIEFAPLNLTEHQIFVDGELHTKFEVGSENTGAVLGYDSCIINGTEVRQIGQVRILSTASQTIQCNLTGMVPDQDHLIEVFGGETLLYSSTQNTSIGDVRPEVGDTSPILFALGAIVFSLVALLSFARWNDAKLGRTKSKLAHFYVAPALLALAVLTFYPVLYGFWLAFTDANQTQLGDQSFIGLDNFWDVFSSDGFLRVTLFTLIWTFANVSAHIAIGLFLAVLLYRSKIRGKVAYRTALLLPWAVPSYISVLVWRGMFQPDGFINDLLGTNIDFLSDPTGAQIIVILVNIWLGVPFMMMSISGALQSLPNDMYEAAEVDGVSGWNAFRYLTLPNLRSALVPLSLLGFIWTFNMFNVIYLMTDGGPNLYFGEPGQTDILITFVYDVAFRDGAYGVAAAWSGIIFMMLFAFSWYYMKQTNATEAVS
ncbi:MAG: hypothetical protein CMA67_05780 [Euryarchaeota archaeon]|nr:hypothetical protein [Euryarchaeota archaeon]